MSGVAEAARSDTRRRCAPGCSASGAWVAGFIEVRSSSENDVLALADMPGYHETFDPIDDPEQEHAEQRQHHQRREHGRQVKSADRALQHIAEAGIGAD